MRRKVIENYALYDILGEGSFGKVYKGLHTVSNEQFAIKVIPVQKFHENSRLQECAANEIKNLTMIEQSPYIIKFVEMLKTSNNIYFVYEFCNGRTLEARLKEDTKLQEQEALKIFNQLMEAFKILNKYNIMHRDLKPENIFFHDGSVKLGDFGFCKTLLRQGDMTSTMLGSPIYMAPEVLKGEIYTAKADIWSLGVVLYQMLFGVCPYESNSIAKLVATLDSSDLKFPSDSSISETTINLLKRMLTKDQFKRIDWFELLTMNLYTERYVFNPTESISTTDSKMLPLEMLRKNHSCPEPTSEAELSGRSNPLVHNQSYQALGSNNNALIFRKKNDHHNVSTGNLNHDNSKFFHMNSVKSNFEAEEHKAHETSFSPKKMDSSNRAEAAMYSTPNIQRRPSTQSSEIKRQSLLVSHNSCLAAVRTAINFIRSSEPNGLIFSFLIFQRIKYLMRRIIDSIGFSELELEDFLSTVSQELKSIQRHLRETENQLHKLNIEPSEMFAPKPILKSKHTPDINKRLWYEMITFLNQEHTNPRSSELEWSATISNYLL